MVGLRAWAAVSIAFCAIACAKADGSEEPRATIRGQTVTLEIARTRAEQSMGLGNRDSLDWGRGMLFVYDDPGFFTFWMKRMRFDIDIVWIREGRIVGIAPSVPYPRDDPSRPATVRPPELVDMVLEVPAGFSAAHGWRRGDRVTLAGMPEGAPTGN